MRFFEALDEFLLSKIFEPFTQWFQRLTGLTTFWWARCMYFLIVVQWGVKSIILNLGTLMIIASMGVLGIFFMIYSIPTNYRKEEECLKNSGKGFGNSMRQFIGLRILFVTLFFIGYLPYRSIFDHINFWLWIGVIYFESCNILPPSKSKISQALDKISTTVQGWYQPSPSS